MVWSSSEEDYEVAPCPLEPFEIGSWFTEVCPARDEIVFTILPERSVRLYSEDSADDAFCCLPEAEEVDEQPATAFFMIHCNIEENSAEGFQLRRLIAEPNVQQRERQERARCQCPCGCTGSGVRKRCVVCAAHIGQRCCIDWMDRCCSCIGPQGDRNRTVRGYLDTNESKTESEDQRNSSKEHASGSGKEVCDFGSSSQSNSGDGSRELPSGRKFSHTGERNWCISPKFEGTQSEYLYRPMRLLLIWVQSCIVFGIFGRSSCHQSSIGNFGRIVPHSGAELVVTLLSDHAIAASESLEGDFFSFAFTEPKVFRIGCDDLWKSNPQLAIYDLVRHRPLVPSNTECRLQCWKNVHTNVAGWPGPPNTVNLWPGLLSTVNAWPGSLSTVNSKAAFAFASVKNDEQRSMLLEQDFLLKEIHLSCPRKSETREEKKFLFESNITVHGAGGHEHQS